MNFSDSVRYLYSLGNETRHIKLGLDQIRKVLAALGNPHHAMRWIHVAGTNGKGSVCAMVESGLRAAGLRTGLYTSPHLNSPTERIQIAGVPVSDDAFLQAFECVRATGVEATYFETVTAMAFLIFRQAQIDVGVIEVGLGGRLDATNVIDPELCIITPVDIDHTGYLGATLTDIAAEKAGILKPGVPVVMAAQHPEAEAVLLARAPRAARTGDCPASIQVKRDGNTLEIAGATIVGHLPGEHQAENMIAAAMALRHLGIDWAAIAAGIGNARWPGRLETVHENPTVMLDGAHNLAGSKALTAYLRRFYPDGVRLVFGVMRDKDVAEIATHLFALAAEIMLVAPDNPRAMPPGEIRTATGYAHARVGATVHEAVEWALSGTKPAVITGSLFLVGEARALLLQ